jgi:hypothetical protein
LSSLSILLFVLIPPEFTLERSVKEQLELFLDRGAGVEAGAEVRAEVGDGVEDEIDVGVGMM